MAQIIQHIVRNMGTTIEKDLDVAEMKRTPSATWMRGSIPEPSFPQIILWEA